MMIGSPDYGYNVNMHDIQEHEQPDDIPPHWQRLRHYTDESLEINVMQRGDHGPSLGRSTWTALSDADQKAWDTITGEGKLLVLIFC
jgi:hypothetical protein